MGAGDHHGHLAGAPAAARAGPRRAREPARDRTAVPVGRAAERYRAPTDAAARSRCALAGPRSRSSRSARRCRSRRTRRRQAGAAARPPRSPARSTPRWRRTSYSALTAGAGHARAGRAAASPRTPGTDDEAGRSTRSADGGVPTSSRRAAAPPCRRRWPSSRSGPAFGTLVHAVFEVADLTAADLPAELTAHCAEQLRRDPVPGRRPRRAGRRAAARSPHTPLGPLAAGCGWPTSPRPTGWPSWTSSCPLAGGDRAVRRTAERRRSATSPRCCAGTCRRRPAARATPIGAGRPGAGRAAAARLPHRQHRRRAAAARPAVRGRRLQDQLARPDRSGRPSR